MIKCQICNKEYKSIQPLSKHISLKHNLSKQDYYDLYLKQSNEGICKICGKNTHFYGMDRGYNSFCSLSCQVSYQQQHLSNENRARQKQKQLDRIAQYEKDHNCTRVGILYDKYGEFWKDQIPVIKISHIEKYINNEYIPKIEELFKMHYQISISKSYLELQVYEYIKSIYNGPIEQNTKLIIKPLELDIYLPNLNLAIEFNGTWFHSIEAGCSKDYHLNKSILCKEKGIRLVHIYEFEHINEQKQLIGDLINGIDNYNPLDFNKNNLIDPIPKPKLIYVSPRGYHIYGAGKLYNK